MRTLTRLFIISLIPIFSGCLEGLATMEPGGKLGDTDYVFLNGFNTTQLELVEAMDLAFGVSRPSNSADKVQRMADMINQGRCSRDGLEPLERYDRSWNGFVEVKGPTSCPLYLSQRWRYDEVRKRWDIYERLNIKLDDFQKLSGLNSKTAKGYLDRVGEGTTRRVYGTIQYPDLSVSPKEHMRASISVNYANRRGEIRLTLSQWPKKEWSYVALIRWDDWSASPRFEVNESEVTQAVFEEMFSAFKVMEIIDRVNQMR